MATKDAVDPVHFGAAGDQGVDVVARAQFVEEHEIAVVDRLLFGAIEHLVHGLLLFGRWEAHRGLELVSAWVSLEDL